MTTSRASPVRARLFALPDFPLIRSGDHLTTLILDRLQAAQCHLVDGDLHTS